MSEKKKRIKKAYPINALEASSFVLVAKNVAIDRNAIMDDVEYLIYHFISKPPHTFEAFDNLWNELHFSHVHFACVKREYRERYMNAFFSCFLDYFNSPLKITKTGVLFSIYFLYMSQPAIWLKNKIRVTKEKYDDLFQFYVDSIKSNENVEAALIFEKLRDGQAFLFVCEQEPNAKYINENLEFEKAIKLNEDLRELNEKLIKYDPVDLCLNKEIEEYKKAAFDYQTNKRKVFYTTQATIATQKMMKESINVIEKRPRLLQNVILNSTLAQDETNTLKLITSAYQQLLNSKRRKLTSK